MAVISNDTRMIMAVRVVVITTLLLAALIIQYTVREILPLDYLYVTNWSLREDLRLILLTLPALTRARSAY